MKKWARFLKRARDEEQRNRLNLVIIATNNHYAGLWPRIANIFRKMLHLSEVKWNENVHVPKAEELVTQKQTTLSDC